MTIKNAFRRGFTLIELMIVIVILGILMGTILPRLTGAQSRARDTARIADLNNISQALEIYFSDFGQYPNAACSDTECDNDNCLDKAAGDATTPVATDTYNLLKSYLKGARVPQNVGVQTDTLGCIGTYYYQPLTKGGTANASYVLASDLETWQMSNFETPDSTPAPSDFVSSSDADDYIVDINKLSSEPATEKMSIYIVIP